LVKAKGIPSTVTGTGDEPVVSTQIAFINEGSILLDAIIFFIVLSNPSI